MALTFLTDHTSPALLALDEKILRGWRARRPDVPVTVLTEDHERLRYALEGHLTSTEPPDVLTWFAGNRTRSLVDRGLMLDVAALWEAPELAAYDPRFRRLSGAGGAAHLLPTSHYWWAVYYRPSVFASLGIAPTIRTWPELNAAARELRSSGIAPFALGARHRCPAAAWFDYLNFRINGPAFHAELMAMRARYTDDRVRAVFDFWRRLLDDGWFLGSPAEYDEEEAVAAVRDGSAGMTLIGSYVTDEYLPADDADLAFIRFPLIDPALPVAEDAPVDGYFAAGRSGSPADAAAFLGYLGSREVQQWTVETLTVLPTRDDVDLRRAGRHVPGGAELLRRADRVFQFYDLDTPWELAEVGMSAFVQFLREPTRVDELLLRVDAARAELSRSTATEGDQ